MLRQNGRVGVGLASPRLDGEFERAAARRAVAVCQPPAQGVVPPGIGEAEDDLRRRSNGSGQVLLGFAAGGNSW